MSVNINSPASFQLCMQLAAGQSGGGTAQLSSRNASFPLRVPELLFQHENLDKGSDDNMGKILLK
jgi:hypothetical protein